MRALGRALLGGTLLCAAAPALPAAADVVRLPGPGTAEVADLLDDVGARPDRVLRSVVPGPVRNDEVVRVGLRGDGSVAKVEVEQRLQLSGEGDYQVRERGPARAAVPLGEEPPPVTKFGAVVWQGFSPGSRELAARLTLDPVLEAPRLPLAVALSYTAPGRQPVPLGPQGDVPGAGTVTVRLTARTAQPATLPTGADVAPAAVAPALDAARRAAVAAPGPRLPAAAAGLPATVEAAGATERPGERAVPLRVTGLVTAPGATVTGPGTTAVPDGGRLSGTLTGGSVEFAVAVPAAGALGLDLQAVPALDPRTLVPPGGAASWAAWAAGSPPVAERRAALDLLVQTAATGARAAAYSPYLGADLPGTGSTAFRWSFVPAERADVVRAPLQPRPGAIALAGVAGLLVLLTTAGLWRAS